MRSSPNAAHRKHHRPAYRWLIGLTLVGGVVLASRLLGEERHFAELVRSAQPKWLFAVITLQLGTYLFLARAWSTAIARAGGVSPSRGALVRLALAELFTDQALPSLGIGGTLLVVRALKRRGVSAEAAAAAVITSLLGLYAAQLVAVSMGIVVLFAHHRLVDFALVIAAAALLASLAVPTLSIVIIAGGLRRLPQRVQRLRAVRALREAIDDAPRRVVLNPRNFVPVSTLRLAILVLDGCSLAASSAALGHPIPVDVAVSTFALASVAGSISFIPGALGSFEALATALFTLQGVPIERAVAAVFLMRGFTFWLPMLPGFWFARRELRWTPSS